MSLMKRAFLNTRGLILTQMIFDSREHRLVLTPRICRTQRGSLRYDMKVRIERLNVFHRSPHRDHLEGATVLRDPGCDCRGK